MGLVTVIRQDSSTANPMGLVTVIRQDSSTANPMGLVTVMAPLGRRSQLPL
jgi:hypothetical protein